MKFCVAIIGSLVVYTPWFYFFYLPIAMLRILALTDEIIPFIKLFNIFVGLAAALSFIFFEQQQSTLVAEVTVKKSIPVQIIVATFVTMIITRTLECFILTKLNLIQLPFELTLARIVYLLFVFLTACFITWFIWLIVVISLFTLIEWPYVKHKYTSV